MKTMCAKYNIYSKTTLALLLIMILSITLIVMSFAADKNLFVDSEDSILGANVDYSEGKLTNGQLGTGAAFVLVPGLTKDYTFRGHVKIIEIGKNPWDGFRVIIGSDANSTVSKFVITKEWATRVEFKLDNMGDLMGSSPNLSEGTEFDFEVVRKGQQYTFTINGNPCLEGEVPEELDAFEVDNDYNLGFEAFNCYYEVTNIEVFCKEAAEMTPAPTPTETPVPTATDEVNTGVTPVVTNTPSHIKDKADPISPVVIVISVIALLAVVAVIVYMVKGKSKK